MTDLLHDLGRDIVLQHPLHAGIIITIHGSNYYIVLDDVHQCWKVPQGNYLILDDLARVMHSVIDGNDIAVMSTLDEQGKLALIDITTIMRTNIRIDIVSLGE